MRVTLVIPEHIAGELLDAASSDVETAGTLLAQLVETHGGDIRLLVREVLWVPSDAYLFRGAEGLRIASHGYVPALAKAEADQAIPIWLHTHPGKRASPQPSVRDKVVDEELADLFQIRSGSPFYAAVVIAQRAGQLRFAGHIKAGGKRSDIDRLWVTGGRLALYKNALHATTEPCGQFDRNIRAFGGEVQEVLNDLSVAIVGCGGTGSAVAEQLTRLGVRRFHLFDPKTLTESNVTRVYGSFPADIGKPKVNVVASHLSRIAPDAMVATERKKITLEATARRLGDVDIIFGCTDDNAGRLVLSRVASFFLTPVIDCGVLLSSGSGGVLNGINGRVTVLAPGLACLVCRERIDFQQAHVEMLSQDEHQRLVDEGYAPALPGVEPAVVAFTTQVAAAAVGELLERLIRYGPDPVPSEVLVRVHEREVSTNHQSPRDGHYCDPRTGKLGLGVTTPFLEQIWQG
ncbi:MAG: ThiF family adenylyltransferase [bacterium]|nr:ThiF family adenylyltransferase [bacterium]